MFTDPIQRCELKSQTADQAAIGPLTARLGDILVVAQKVVSKADGRYIDLADVTPEGELVPIVDLPNFGMADVSDEWVAWVPADQIAGDVREYDEIRVRRLDGDRESVLAPPAGWRFENTPFTFEDPDFFVVRVTDGQQQRMARCSPGLQECVLLGTP